ncbi:HAMP domain-containing sensor histidine kinase [Actinoplanes sp. NPDC026619]|uniref:HAMP domain-containing sensor histidine kinase n=1 Tax=Actinoplanes sp. NPDC026619 TaxID=3155798 RepID=UPI0033D32F41
MSMRSPARRILVLCAVLLLAAQFARPAVDELLQLARDFGPTWCVDGPALACRFPGLVTIPAVAAVLLLMLAACWLVISWCLRPILDLVPVIANVGPQNLGHRLRPGAGHDELAVLGRAIDEMMDRIAIGYEAQRRFAADASHELRTPLAVQRTLIEVSMARTLTDDQLTLLTAQLLETNERNERLIEGLLVLAESDRGLLARAPLRLDEIVAAIVDRHQPGAAEVGITISTELRPRLVLGEQVLLERLVSNLVQNAIKYNRKDGTVTIEVGNEPALTVTNTGDDVPPDEVSALFEPFRRRNAARIDHSGGAGLGLSIARSITRAHDGMIAASSTGHDGLRVQVSLPPAPHLGQ